MIPPITEIFNDPECNEWHSWLIGVSHGFFFWQKHTLPPVKEDEEHYYEQGKIAGFMMLILFQVGICWLVKLVIF